LTIEKSEPKNTHVAVRVLRHEVDPLEDVVVLLLVAEVGEDDRRLRELRHDVVDLPVQQVRAAIAFAAAAARDDMAVPAVPGSR
jgi:hypothetical protein